MHLYAALVNKRDDAPLFDNSADSCTAVVAVAPAAIDTERRPMLYLVDQSLVLKVDRPVRGIDKGVYRMSREFECR